MRAPSFFILSALLISTISAQVTRSKTSHPSYVVTSTNVEETTGCWAKIYELNNFKGQFITILGETYWPDLMSKNEATWDKSIGSTKVGPNAQLTLYGEKHFKDMDHNINAGITITNINQIPEGDSIESLTLVCAPEL